MKRTFILCAILQLAEWLFFMLCDYQEEHGGGILPNPFTAIVLLTFVTVPALLLICRSMRNSVQNCGRCMQPVLLAGIWFFLCGASFALFTVLGRLNLMPVSQYNAADTWGLNGIEYGLFPANNLIAGCGVLLLTALFRRLFPGKNGRSSLPPPQMQ
ncbi:MAG: hypothetical protein IKI58_07005 [Oscillospiraceae bacterium]|nr:hypothetical protein [Oscillospiraceae bacterium]